MLLMIRIQSVMQDEVSRILSSNICESIASTVSRNQVEIDELEQLFRQRSQQILEIQKKIAGEVSFFERLHEKDSRTMKRCDYSCQKVRQLRLEVQQLKGMMQSEMRMWHDKMTVSLTTAVQELHSKHQQELQEVGRQHKLQLTDLKDEVLRLNEQISSLNTELAKEREGNLELRRINTQLKKEELSRIFRRKPSVENKSHKNTTDSDILRTLEHGIESTSVLQDITRFTQPNLQNTTILDFSRKGSMLALSSSTAALTTERCVFNFKQLVEEHYEGRSLNGKKVGKCVVTYQLNYMYRGEFGRGMREGQGVLFLDSQEVYSGEWQNDLFHGKGRLTLMPTGKQYREWKSYCGHFEGGKIEGLGTVTLLDGSSMICSFRNGQPESHTVIFDNKNNVFYGETSKKGVFNRKL